MHKFNTFAHDIQVNNFSKSVTTMPYFLLATIPLFSYDCSQIVPLLKGLDNGSISKTIAQFSSG